jgi:nicotinate-nucleotide adenylyltransferase
MRIGVFGGSFDPVHYGHLLLAECCREQCRLDRVVFVPSAVPPHKQDRRLTPAAARIEMLELAIAGNDAFSVNRYETDRGGVNYTVDTLAHFRDNVGEIARMENAGPDFRLFFLMGADMLGDLPHWREARRVLELCTPLVVPRPAEPIAWDALAQIATPEQIDEIRGHQVAMPPVGISSREIRRRVRAGRSIRYQMPRAVEMYVQVKGLYREDVSG